MRLDEKNQNEWHYPLFLAAAALLWGMNGTLTKLITWSGLTCAIVRGCITIIAATCLLKQKIWRIKFNHWKLICGICYFAQGTLLIMSMKYTTAASATVLQNTSPIYIMVMNAFMWRIYPKKKDIIACTFLLTGVALSFAGSIQLHNIAGNVLACLSGLFYAGVFFLSKHPSIDDPVEPMLIGNAVYLLLLPACFTDSAFLHPNLVSWIAQITLGLFCGFSAWMLFSIGIRKTSSLTANFITMLEPAAGSILAFLVIGEQPTLVSLAGCILIMVTLLWYQFSQHKTEALDDIAS